MKICIWWATTTDPWGGGNSFLRALKDQLVEQGHTVTSRPAKGDEVVLINSWNLGPGKYNSPARVEQVRATGSASWLGPILPPQLWKLFGHRGPALAHRLDGVAEVVRGSPGRADPVQFGINAITDWTVFQSQYIRETFARYNVAPGNASVVYNGVDPEVFYPNPGHTPGSTLRLVSNSWSTNPDKGFAHIARFSELPDVEVVHIGQWPDDTPPRNVQTQGVKRRDEIADLLRTADGFLHPAKNEGSSNSLVEALATGLPTIYLDSGSNRELAGDYGVEITDDPEATLAEFRANHTDLRERLLADRDRFLIATAATQYVEAFEAAIAARATA